MNKHLYSFWDILSYVVKWTIVLMIGLILYYMGKDISETKKNCSGNSLDDERHILTVK